MKSQTSTELRHGLEAADASLSLSRQVTAYLHDSPYRALRSVGCRCECGVVTLTGIVTSFHLKQIAQTLVAKLPGVQRVINQLEVADS